LKPIPIPPPTPSAAATDKLLCDRRTDGLAIATRHELINAASDDDDDSDDCGYSVTRRALLALAAASHRLTDETNLANKRSMKNHLAANDANDDKLRRII